MRKLILYLSITLLISCSHKVTTNYQAPAYPMAASTCNPKIVKKKNLYGLNANYLGSIKLDEPITYMNRKVCSEAAAIEKLKSQACGLNANLINIISEIKPGETIPPYHRSACYRCIANFYSIEWNEVNNTILTQANRKTTKYDDKKGITWNDVEIELPDSCSFPYEFISNIEIVSGKMSVWTGAYKEFKAQGVFYCDVSKVKKSFKTIQNEKQLELLFDLTQIYANRAEVDLNSRKPKIANKEKIQTIIDGYLTELETEKAKFNFETAYGNNKLALQNWESRIKSELSQYD